MFLRKPKLYKTCCKCRGFPGHGEKRKPLRKCSKEQLKRETISSKAPREEKISRESVKRL